MRRTALLSLLSLLLIGCDTPVSIPKPPTDPVVVEPEPGDGTPPSLPPDTQVPEPLPPDSPLAQLAILHNQARAEKGLEPLWMQPQLMAAAAKHATWMAENNRMSHVGAGGSQPADRISAEGYKWQTGGENVAVGYKTPLDVFAGWMNSSGHRENILRPQYTDIGLGMTKSAAGKWYWCAVFARPLTVGARSEEFTSPDGLERGDEEEQIQKAATISGQALEEPIRRINEQIRMNYNPRRNEATISSFWFDSDEYSKATEAALARFHLAGWGIQPLAYTADATVRKYKFWRTSDAHEPVVAREE